MSWIIKRDIFEYVRNGGNTLLAIVLFYSGLRLMIKIEWYNSADSVLSISKITNSLWIML